MRRIRIDNFNRVRYIVVMMIIGVSLALLSPGLSAQDEKEEKKELLIKKMNSDDSLLRQVGRKELTEYLEKKGYKDTQVDVTLYYKMLTAPDTSYQVKLGISDSLGRLRNQFWTVENQEQAEQLLYQLYLEEKNPTFKRRLDEALMSAKGLYRDGIYDFFHNLVDKPGETAAKFQRVINRYPESSFAPKAHYYLGRYYIRVYLIEKKNGKNPDAGEWLGNKSNAELLKFIADGNKESSIVDQEDILVAHYFLAVNHMILSRLEESEKELKIIRDNPNSKMTRVDLEEAGILLDERAPKKQFLTLAEIVEKTIAFLEMRQTRGDQSDIVKSFFQYLHNEL